MTHAPQQQQQQQQLFVLDMFDENYLAQGGDQAASTSAVTSRVRASGRHASGREPFRELSINAVERAQTTTMATSMVEEATAAAGVTLAEKEPFDAFADLQFDMQPPVPQMAAVAAEEQQLFQDTMAAVADQTIATVAAAARAPPRRTGSRRRRGTAAR